MNRLQRIVNFRQLYKSALRLHRGLPETLRSLGDSYVKAEFRRIAATQLTEQQEVQFLNEWADYCKVIAKQLIQDPRTPVRFGKALKESDVDAFNSEQVGQLYELFREVSVTSETPADHKTKPASGSSSQTDLEGHNKSAAGQQAASTEQSNVKRPATQI